MDILVIVEIDGLPLPPLPLNLKSSEQEMGKPTRRKTRKLNKRPTRGGFYPSLMSGVLSNGPLFFTPAIAQGVRLLRNSTARLNSRKRRANKNRKRQ